MLLFLLACDPSAEPPGCLSMIGMSRDQCLLDESRALSEPEAVREKVAQIEDDIIREAAVMTWVKTHGCDHPREEILPLCDMIVGGLQGKCRRKIDAIHLCR